jgi:hypothetical protein
MLLLPLVEMLMRLLLLFFKLKLRQRLKERRKIKLLRLKEIKMIRMPKNRDRNFKTMRRQKLSK